jgi:hypothetical protein
MPQLQPIADAIWTTSFAHRWMGLHIGTRMTVIRLSTGGIVLHSPVPITEQLRAEIDAVGPVAHIVCPNLYHHVYAGQAVTTYPKALLHGPSELRHKCKDLVFGADLSHTPHPDWKSDLIPLPIDGCLLRETVFFHPATRTLITCDLVENFESSPHWPTRTYLKLAGIHGHIGWSRLLRFLYRDRKAARASIDRLLEWPFDRVIISHGNIISENARETIRHAFAWL